MMQERGLEARMVQAGRPDTLDLTFRVVVADGTAVFAHDNIREIHKTQAGAIHHKALEAAQRWVEANGAPAGGPGGSAEEEEMPTFTLDEDF